MSSWWRRRDSLPGDHYDPIALQDDRPVKKRCQDAFLLFGGERRAQHPSDISDVGSTKRAFSICLKKKADL